MRRVKVRVSAAWTFRSLINEIISGEFSQYLVFNQSKNFKTRGRLSGSNSNIPYSPKSQRNRQLQTLANKMQRRSSVASGAQTHASSLAEGSIEEDNVAVVGTLIDR